MLKPGMICSIQLHILIWRKITDVPLSIVLVRPTVWLLNFVDILLPSFIFFSISFMCFCNSFYFSNEEKLVT